MNNLSKFNLRMSSKTSFSLLSLVSLSACQFGKSSALNGAVIKGPLENALVFLDYNNNGSHDASEPSVRTNSDGTFSISGQSGFGFTVLTDNTTVDSSSGEVLADVVLKAPSGSAIVSPTTTVMEETGLSAVEVAAVLGLPEGVDPTQFNPFADNVDADTALAVEKVAHQVMTTVTAIQSAIEGTGADTADAFSVAMESVASVVMEKGENYKANPNAPVDVIDFTDATEMSELTEVVANKVSEQGIGDTAAFNAIADDLESAVINVNAAIDDATDISSEESQALFALSSDLKEQVKAAAEDPDNAENAITFTASEAVETAKDEKVVEIIAFKEAEANEETNEESTDSATDTSSDEENTDPVELSVPTILTSYSNPLLNTGTPKIEGTATAGNTVEVFDDGEFVTTIEVDEDGNWSITPDSDDPLEDGTYSVTFKQKDANGNESASSVPLEFQIDTTAPEVPVITNSNLTALPGLATLTGTADAESIIEVFSGETSLGTITAEDNGNWSFTVSESLTSGDHIFKATATDLAGNTSLASSSVTIVVDADSPDAPTISNTADSTVSALPTIQGLAEAGSVVEVFAGESSLGTVTATEDGSWSLTVSNSLTMGSTVFSATATDAVGNISAASAGVALNVTITNGDVFDVSGNEWVLVSEINGTYTLISVKGDPSSSGQLVYDDNRTPMRELSDDDVELFLGNPPALNENIASNKLEFAAIKGAGSTGLINGDIYIVNSDERLLLVEESDGSYSLIPVTDGAGVFSLEYDETRQDQISRDLDAAGVEAVIGSTRYLDDNILLQPSMYNEIEQASSSTPTFLGLVELPDPNGGGSNISLNVATVKEFTPGAFLGELSFVDPSGGGGGVFPIYEVTSGMMMFIEDNDGDWTNDQTVTPGFYAMDGANSRVYEVAQNNDGVYEFTTETAILIQSFQTYEPQKIIDSTNFTSLDDITLQPSSDDPNIIFAAESSDIFTLDGNKLFLRDDRYFEEGYGDNGLLIDTNNPNSGWDLGSLTLTVEVSGDFFSTGRINLLDTGDGDYFGIDSAVITDVDGFTFTPFNFNSFQPGDELGAITSTGFDFDTIGLVSGLFVEIVGNTIKLKDNAYYDVNTDTFYEIGGGFSSLSDMDKINIVASEGDLDLLSGSILYSNLVTGGQVKQIPNFAGPPVAEKIVPIDVIGYVQVGDGDDVAAIDAAAATEVAGIITAAGLSGPVSDGHIYKTSADENFLLAFEGSSGSEIFSLIPVTRADSSSPWGYDNTRLLVGNLDLSGVTAELGTAPVEHDVLGTIMQSSGISTHFASDPFYDGKGLGDGDDIIITYSFVKEDATNFGDNYTSPDPNSDKIWEFTDLQKEQTREALSAFSDVANIYFHEISETDDIVGTFRFGMTDHELYGNKDAAGWAYGPGSSHLNADVWIPIYDENDPDTSAAEHDMSAGTMGGLTMLHEIGHALGLKHTFEHPVVNRSLESNTYTLMSYTPPEEGWYDSGIWAISYTPMVLDVAALQFLYGAQTHNETDTTYSWDETIPFGSTIWDSSGIDTLDFSNFTLGHDISLVDGTSSTISFPVRDYNTQTGWDVGQLIDNLTIAHGAIIENAIGGGGNDKITGNDRDNILTGGAGADIFEFNSGFGSDTITDFVLGEDTLRFLDSDGSTVITDTSAFNVAASIDGADLVLSILGDDLTLEDVGTTSFDDSFLELA